MVNGSLLVFLCPPCDLFLYVVYLGTWAWLIHRWVSIPSHCSLHFPWGPSSLPVSCCFVSPPVIDRIRLNLRPPFSLSVCILILILIHVAHCLYYMLAPNHSNHRFVHCQARGQSRREVAANDVGPFKRRLHSLTSHRLLNTTIHSYWVLERAR